MTTNERAETDPVTTPRRMLYVTAALPPTRVPEADHALHQCLHMASAGIEVHVLTRRGQGIDEHPSITVHDVVESWSWRELMVVVRLIRTIRPDAFMISFLGSLFGYRTMPTMIPLLARILRPRATTLVQFANLGQGLGIRNRAKRILFQRLGRLKYGSLLVVPDVLVVLSADHRARIEALAPSMLRRTHLIPCSSQIEPAADTAAARAVGRRLLGVPEADTVVSFFGRLYPGKGIEQLIEAVASLRPARPDLQLVLIGGFLDTDLVFGAQASYQQDLQATIESFGATDFVRFSGEFDWEGTEASQYLFASDVAALPLVQGIHLYNSSLAAVCAHGIPVIGTRGGIVDPPLRHRDTVYLIDGSEPADIAEALATVLDDADLRRTLADGSRRLGTEQFDGKVSTARLLGLMKLGESSAAVQARVGS